VDLIDEQHVILFQVGQDSGQIAGPFDCRPGGDADVDAKLVGDDMRQGSLAQAGRAVQQGMIQRFLALLGRIDQDGQVFDDLLLPDNFVQVVWAQGGIAAIIRMGLGAAQPLGCVHSVPVLL